MLIQISRSTCPRPGHCGHESMSHSTVVGLADRADKTITNLPSPGPAHALACMAAVALAPGFSVEYGSPYLCEVPLMNPRLGDSHYLAAVVEHERITIGVAEEIEGKNRTGRECINRLDCFLSIFDPDESAVALGRLRLDPLRIGLSIALGTVDVSGPVYDPEQVGIFSMFETNLSHAQG